MQTTVENRQLTQVHRKNGHKTGCVHIQCFIKKLTKCKTL